MQAWLRRFVLCLLAWSMAGSSVAAKGKALDLPTTVLEGSWRQVDGDRLCYFQDRELVTFGQGKQSVFGVEHFRPGGLLIVRNEGKLETWKAEVHDRILTIGKDENIQSYRRLAEIPSAVVLQPFPLGDSHPLPPDQIRGIQYEVERRWRLDQAVRSDPAKEILQWLVDADNRAYFFYLVRQVGWPDVARFGVRTSVFATLFVKHFSYLPLNLAALPFVERDLRTTGEGQVFAILFDDTLLHLGRKQRYGTQLDDDAQGNPYVLPLEHPDQVDELLYEIGESPLSTYLAQASHFLYDDKSIRLAKPDE